MKNKFSTIYAVFASLIFVLTIFYFGFNLYSEYSHGYVRTKKTFDQLSLSVKQNTDKIKITDLNDYAYIEIAQNNAAFYKYPTKDAKSNPNSKLIKNYVSSFKIGEDTFFISADMYLLRPSSIRFYARNSFVIILIITLITILMLITLTVSEKDTYKIEDSEENEKPQMTFEEFENSTQKSDEIEIETDANLNNQIDEDGKIDLNKDILAETKDEISNKQNEITDSISPVIAPETKLPSEEVKPVSFEQTDNNPYGLFSPKSGICWESYLLTRLDNELNRATSSEFDLAIFIIKIKDIDNNTDKLKEICDYLTIQFQFKDMLFEYKDDCIAAIKVSMSLDDAIEFADKLHTDIEDITASKCYIGISTRTIRIISAERLLQEADEALAHAQEEVDTPIIAFRANAEKYRQYLEQNK